MKSIITNNSFCLLCNRPADHMHHMLSGSNRTDCENDGLKIPVCAYCHDKIHRDPKVDRIVKCFAQAVYESRLGTREDFIKRYSRSYL